VTYRTFSHVPLEWRRAFLTTGTWQGMTPTDTELTYALMNWTPETTVAQALDTLKHRRILDARGFLQREQRLRMAQQD